MHQPLAGTALIAGQAAGPVLYAGLGLSFMGGVDAATGRVIDIHHPLHGQSLAGRVLAIPSGRGSCSGSLVMFELLMNGHAPAALVVCHKEPILTLGVMIAVELFQRGIPVIQLDQADFVALSQARHAQIDGATLHPSDTGEHLPPTASLPALDHDAIALGPLDRAMLAGDHGAAAQLAMRIILQVARIEGARELVDVAMGHIDGCFYQGPAGLRFAQGLVDRGARVRIPTTMNAICVDRRQWRAQGVDATVGTASDAIAEAYVAMGVAPSYTCAPYLLSPQPQRGQCIAWGESNAVAFANSVLGARTLKYPDYLDILVALTGRAPLTDAYLDLGRRATLRLDLPPLGKVDDAFFPLLGYLAGKLSPNDIPLICGLQDHKVTHDDLKALGAAFATTSAAPMFHILGITPEAPTLDAATGPQGPARHLAITHADLAATWAEMTTAPTPRVDLVALGNPHFSVTEIAALAALCKGRRVASGVDLIVTCGRQVLAQAEAAGHAATLRAFGGRFLTDTCWCFIAEPVVPAACRGIATNSGKYAHYGPAATGKPFHFAGLAACVDAACTGQMGQTVPDWS